MKKASPNNKAIQSTERWLAQHVDEANKPRTVRHIVAALVAYAGTVRGNTWRRLRSELARHQAAHGYDKAAHAIRDTKNPIPVDERTKKPPRMRRIPEDDAVVIRAALQRRLAGPEVHEDDRLLAAVVMAVAALGVRPAELATIRIDGNEVVIQGAKRRADRGMEERRVTVPASSFKSLQRGLPLLQTITPGSLHRIQERFRRMMRAEFPRRKVLPSLYSFRHQLGSDLKKMIIEGELDDVKAAAIMGHRSVESIQVYGRPRSGSRRPVRAAAATVEAVIQRQKSGPPGRRAAKPTSTPGPGFRN